MRSSRMITTLGLFLACFLELGVPAFGVRGPVAVSPGATDRSDAVEARCPTFQWAGVPGARGYELTVFRVSDDGAEPALVTRASVPGDARGWTPPSRQCLERGQRYAWSVAVAAAAPDWSPPFLFEIEAAPSLEEVEQAIATLQRYREHEMGDEPVSPTSTIAAADMPEPHGGGSFRAPLRTREPREPLAADSPLPGALTSPTSGVVRVASAATPTLGIPSLKVSANVALGASSNLFKDYQPFLWDDATGNTALGRNALLSASGSAIGNTALGREALLNTTGTGLLYGSQNTAVGDQALKYDTTGFRNVATGFSALRSNTSGSENTAGGVFTLHNNTTGFSNTASGSSALFSNTTGDRNTASGTAALLFNTTGSRNTASGYSALRVNTTGSRNTASGDYALGSGTTGNLNTASGAYALRNNVGDFNTASGAFALRYNSTGSQDTANGYKALYKNTTGTFNTASGTLALFSNTTGFRNTASGALALFSNTTGYRNTALGNLAGYNNTDGDDSIFINNEGVAGDTATIRIGTQPTQTKTFIAGIQGKTTGVSDAIAVLIDSNGQLGTISSSRILKQDIQDLGALDERLLELRPVAFRYKQHVLSDPDTPLQFGLIAEEVAEVFPELVVYDEEGKPETVKYHLLSSLLLGELQKQQGELEGQRDALRAMRDRLEALESRSPSSHPQPRGGR